MRNIKFKVWDKWEKKWVDLERWHIVFYSSWFHLKDDNNNEILGKDVELVEFTSLHDKNGKEIYEGDILRIFDKNYEVKIKTTESKYFVDYGYPDKHNGPAAYWVEIIGNIHNNPELLKEVKDEK